MNSSLCSALITCSTVRSMARAVGRGKGRGIRTKNQGWNQSKKPVDALGLTQGAPALNPAGSTNSAHAFAGGCPNSTALHTACSGSSNTLNPLSKQRVTQQSQQLLLLLCRESPCTHSSPAAGCVPRIPAHTSSPGMGSSHSSWVLPTPTCGQEFFKEVEKIAFIESHNGWCGRDVKAHLVPLCAMGRDTFH